MPATEASPLLRLSNLSIGHAGESLVEGIDAVVAPGAIVCLVGPNGAGKSTLLRTAAGLLPALAGTIELTGKPLAAWSTAERARLRSAVFADRGPPIDLTAEAFVAAARHPYTNWLGKRSAADFHAVAEALDLVGIAGLAGRTYSDLSDGERQKCCLARGLAQRAPLLLLDEPFAFFDAASRRVVLAALRNRAVRTGGAIVLSVHQNDLISEADVVWRLSPGRFEVGNPYATFVDGTGI